jgi:hypothetical protein
VNGLPLAIRQQGLARALQMQMLWAEKQKGKKKQGARAALGDICEGVLAWHEAAGEPANFAPLIDEVQLKEGPNERTGALIEKAVNLGFWDYAVLQREVIEIVAWLKILSQTYKKKQSHAAISGADRHQQPDETPEQPLALNAEAGESQS